MNELQDKLQTKFKLDLESIKLIVAKVQKLLSISGENNIRLDKCAKLFQSSAKAQEGIAELKEVIELLKESNIKTDNVEVDFSIARGLDYFTGTVMETTLNELPNFGSVFSV